MPAPTATISGGTNAEAVRAAVAHKNRTENPEYVFIGNANLTHVPKYYVRIFNVSEIEVKIERPWVNYNSVQRGKMIVIPAKQKDERVSKPFTIADVVQIPLRNDSNKTATTIGQTGDFLAQDAINPEDMTGSWRTVKPVGGASSMNENVNLYHWGLFWTRNEVPTDEEVNTAVDRLESNYNRLIEEAKMLWALGDKGRQQIGNTHRRAAGHFGIEFEWNVLYRATKECPECGAKAPTGASACHRCPYVYNWEKALAGGMRTTAQAIAAGIIEEQAEDLAKPRTKRK